MPCKANYFIDRGAGCCANAGAADLYNSPVGITSLQDCVARSLTHADSTYVVYGWAGSNHCGIYSRTATTCSSLDSRHDACGSSGDNGVRTYELQAELVSRSEPFLAEEDLAAHARLDGWGAYFSRTWVNWMTGARSSEKHARH